MVTGVDISDLKLSGQELVFIVYPAAMSYLPFTRFWLFVFFMALILIGIDSQFALIETCSYIMIDFKLKHKGKEIKEEYIRLLFCVLSFVIGAVFSTRQGFDYLSFINSYVINIPLVLVNFVNFLAFGKVSSEEL